MRVLLVDDDRTSLHVWGRMLQVCGYEVTKCLRAEDALFMLRTYKSRFDILISDLHMPGMDGFKLLQIVAFEMTDLPVIVMSSDDDYSTIQKGIINGACDFLVKPIPMEALKMVWKYVFSKRRIRLDGVQRLWNLGHGEVHLRPYIDQHNMFSQNEGIKRLKRERDGEDECKASSDHVVGAKQSRMMWTPDLHEKFVATVNELGPKRAVPKKIMERMQAMGVPNLTREKVASHLQKYRLYLQKLKDDELQQNEHLAPLQRPLAVPSLVTPHTCNHMQGYKGQDAQMNLPNEVLKNTHPNQLNLLTQIRRARTVRNTIRSSQLKIVTEGFQNLPVPVEAYSCTTEDSSICGYQSKSLMTQMADQTPTTEQIWNEINGGQVLDENVAATEVDGSTCNPKSEFSGLETRRDTSGDYSFFFKNNALRRSSGDCGLLLNEYTLFRENSGDYSSLWNEICTPSQA